ncbi:hypothetical protein Droror1_Dr00023683 [Drosera rotundifolia]
MKSSRKPPLVRLPMPIQPHLSLRSNVTTPLRTPSGYLSKVEKPNHPATAANGKENRPDYCTIASELQVLAKMVEKEFGIVPTVPIGTGFGDVASTNDKDSLFERGRVYDEYSARRNERLKRKRGEEMWLTAEPKTAYKLGVKVDESAKRTELKKHESLVKSVSAAYYSVDRSEHPRYALRSIKKPPLPVPLNLERSGGGCVRKTRPPRAPRHGRIA